MDHIPRYCHKTKSTDLYDSFEDEYDLCDTPNLHVRFNRKRKPVYSCDYQRPSKKIRLNDELKELKEVNDDLIKRNQELESAKTVMTNSNECVVCFEAIKKKIAIIPCGHTSSCKQCLDSFELKKCPVCRVTFKKTLFIF